MSNLQKGFSVIPAPAEIEKTIKQGEALIRASTLERNAAERALCGDAREANELRRQASEVRKAVRSRQSENFDAAEGEGRR